MTFKEKYEQAKKNAEYYASIGNLDKAEEVMEIFRGDEISRRIAARGYPSNAQTALAFNALKDIVNGTTEHLEELKKYEAVREAVKAEVDAEIQNILITIK